MENIELFVQRQLDPLIEQYLKAFSGDESFISGVKAGMYLMGGDMLKLLHKQLTTVHYSNGYPIEAVPKSALVGLTSMLKLQAKQ